MALQLILIIYFILFNYLTLIVLLSFFLPPFHPLNPFQLLFHNLNHA
jgi:hypothetical protein